MNKKIKYVGIILLIFLALFSLCLPIFAKTDAEVLNTMTTLNNGTGDMGDAGNATRNVMGTIINVIQIVGAGVAIIMLVMVAIKYMTAAPSERAEFKKSAVAYIVGAVILFGATGVLSIIQNFATKNLK